MRFGGVLLVLLAAATPARADVWTDLAADQRAVRDLEAGRSNAEVRRAMLDRDSQALAAQIDHVKQQPAGVRRDLKLQGLLAAQKSKSDDLERIAMDVRGRSSLLAGARRKLIADCDRALATQLPEARRLELTRLRTAQVAALATPERPLGVAQAAADPLDGPRELQDKADLLRDSEDKLRREVQRLAARIDGVERRRHLRERAGAVDQDLFDEATVNRHSPRVAATLGSGDRAGAPATNSGGATQGAGAPAPGTGGATGGGGSAGGGSGSGGAGVPSGGGSGGGTAGGSNGGTTTGGTGGGTLAGGDTATVLRNLVDPATLDELRRSDSGDDLDRQLRALRRAQGELQGLANELDKRARDLSTRANELRHQK